ncbi:hypothetical protein J6590_046659 [Homalodisca vitripennis]|nr:hypothetical protein J6590_046659 [Homalodisca vitripennis]
MVSEAVLVGRVKDSRSDGCTPQAQKGVRRDTGPREAVNCPDELDNKCIFGPEKLTSRYPIRGPQHVWATDHAARGHRERKLRPSRPVSLGAGVGAGGGRCLTEKSGTRTGVFFCGHLAAGHFLTGILGTTNDGCTCALRDSDFRADRIG